MNFISTIIGYHDLFLRLCKSQCQSHHKKKRKKGAAIGTTIQSSILPFFFYNSMIGRAIDLFYKTSEHADVCL